MPVTKESLVSESNATLKSNALDLAAEIVATGGPHNLLQKGMVDLAEVTGSTLEEIALAADELRPRILGG